MQKHKAKSALMKSSRSTLLFPGEIILKASDDRVTEHMGIFQKEGVDFPMQSFAQSNNIEKKRRQLLSLFSAKLFQQNA
jgi:hypothetical protein